MKKEDVSMLTKKQKEEREKIIDMMCATARRNGLPGDRNTIAALALRLHRTETALHRLALDECNNPTYDEKKQKVVEKQLGSFSQFPIKPAWALTVHKSQGLTFNRVVIDFAGGAFTSGQTYVALSRCTSLDGITLLRPLSERDFVVNPAIIEFSRQFNNQAAIDGALSHEQARQLHRRALHAYDHGEMRQAVESFAQAEAIVDVLQMPAVQRLIACRLARANVMAEQIKTLEQQIDNYREMLRGLAQEYCDMGNQTLGMGSLVSEEAVAYGDQPALDDIAISSALANFDKALRICPDCVEAMVGKGRLYVVIDEPERAEAMFKNAVKCDKGNYDAHMALAELYQSRGSVPNAVKSYKRAIKADKQQPAPHEALQAIYERLGLDDLAEEHEAIARRLRSRRSPRK